MDYIFQAGLILLLELNIFYLVGCIIENLKIFPKEQNVSGRFICGFIGYHFIFWCISFPQTMMNGSLDFLTITWTIVLIIILLASLMVYHRNIFKAYSEVVQMCWKYKLYIIPCILLHVFLVYYVCVNGQNDVDARNYIGQVTVMLDTNKLAGVLTATGAIMDEILFKRAFSMLGANSAVMCNIFSMHPLVYCRTVRAAVNIIVLAVATFSVLKWVYKNKEDVVEHSIMVVMFANTFLFLFTNSIYTSSSFILYRTYEGKAYTAGTLVMIAIYMSIKLCETNNIKYFIMIFITMIASMSISATATFIPPVIIGSIIIAYIFSEKKWNYMWRLLLSLSPNIVYILISITGFAGFQLEG